MNNETLNDTGFLNAIEGLKPIGELKLWQMFFSYYKDKGLCLGIVLEKNVARNYVAHLRFERDETGAGSSIFRQVPMDPHYPDSLPGNSFVLAIRLDLKIDGTMEQLQVVDFNYDHMGKPGQAGDHLGCLAFVDEDESENTSSMAVISFKGKNSDSLNGYLIKEPGDECDPLIGFEDTIFYFDEWYGVVGDQKVFTVRSEGLCKEKQKEASLTMEASEPEKPSSEE